MIQWVLEGVQVAVDTLPDGGKLLRIFDPPSGATVICPLPEQVAKQIGGALLATGIQVVGEMPRDERRNGQ